MPTTLLWLRRDLRLADHAALHAPVADGDAIVPVFIWAPEAEGTWNPASASRWWLHQSLLSLDRDLARKGSRLIVRRGAPEQELASLLVETGAHRVVWQRQYEPHAVQRDQRIKAWLKGKGVTAESFAGSLLFEPWTVKTKDGGPYQVYTPFWKACLSQAPVAFPLPMPPQIPAPRQWPASVAVEALGLLPRVDWAAGFRGAWQPGESGAQELLRRFLDAALADYATARDRPSELGTSRLSPHLHFGEISPRQVWAAIDDWLNQQNLPARIRDAETFHKEVVWREFGHHLLYHFPRTADEPLRAEFSRFPWRTEPEQLRAWQRGRTGYPIVDAGMRELWTTGWMHNRVRMIVASFLVKHLLHPWQVGAKWFWDTLVDADLANNTLGWQWTAGCGADAAPYFRIFNPILQGQRFDPAGQYVRRWVPELADLDAEWIHEPWAAPPESLAAAGIDLGKSYPAPLVNHSAARAAALAALASLKA